LTAKKTSLSKEDRERNRQLLLDEMSAICQAEHDDRQREQQKKLACRSDLLGQMEYNERQRRENRQEQTRMTDKQKEAEDQFQQEVKYLLDRNVSLKWNTRRKQLPDEHKISCT